MSRKYFHKVPTFSREWYYCASQFSRSLSEFTDLHRHPTAKASMPDNNHSSSCQRDKAKAPGAHRERRSGGSQGQRLASAMTCPADPPCTRKRPSAKKSTLSVATSVRSFPENSNSSRGFRSSAMSSEVTAVKISLRTEARLPRCDTRATVLGVLRTFNSPLQLK